MCITPTVGEACALCQHRAAISDLTALCSAAEAIGPTQILTVLTPRCAGQKTMPCLPTQAVSGAA